MKRWKKAPVAAGNVAFGGVDCQQVLSDKAERIRSLCNDLMRISRQMDAIASMPDSIDPLDWHYAATTVNKIALDILEELCDADS